MTFISRMSGFKLLTRTGCFLSKAGCVGVRIHQPPTGSVAETDPGEGAVQDPTRHKIHDHTLMRTHKNSHTHAPNVKTNNNGRRTLTLTIHTLYSQVQDRHPIGATGPRNRTHAPELKSHEFPSPRGTPPQVSLMR
ncbi:hypothetical protein AMECASPLE_034328 [Ameca splendens]|uniref:Secreted protein n=1 Tax=Ameca splendens TaxID=208324 RepID=A0ABV1AE63_9TELE